MTKEEYLMMLGYPELDLLRALAVGEAEGEGYWGMVAVCFVAVNRVRYASMALVPWWPRNLKRAILQKHQFSCFWEDWSKRKKAIMVSLGDPSRFPTADLASRDVYYKRVQDPTGGADHYFSVKIKPPSWAKSMKKTVRIGNHEFFRSVSREFQEG